MSSTTIENSAAEDARVIALIGLAHGTSHFFHLLVPPLFPWLMREFTLDFTAIGATMTVFFIVSGVGQALAGFFVDRFGSVRVLLAGMLCFLCSGTALALAHSYVGLLMASALAGLGNSVLHPADFTVLNRRVSTSRLGHAFSAHALSGNLGWAAAPIFMTGLATFAGWRTAAAAAGLVALPAIVLLLWFRSFLEEQAPATGKSAAGATTLAFLGSGPVWMCFGFFFLVTAAFGAIQNFIPSILHGLYDLPLTVSAASLSVYMLVSGVGIIVGGFIAKRAANEWQIAAALVIAALLALVMASAILPGAVIPVLLAGIGFFTGIAGPSRDLLVRKAATARFGQAAYGRVYGFVYSGLDLGLATAPLIFGAFMDHGRYSMVLIGIAIFQALAVLTALSVGKVRA